MECSCTFLAFWWYLTYPNFVAYNFNRFLAFDYTTRVPKKGKSQLKSGNFRLKQSSYSGNSPSTRQMYSFCTWRFRIWCSICLAFLGLRPNSKRPDVKRSRRWIVRKFFKLYSFASIKTTVLWRYRPQGWTCWCSCNKTHNSKRWRKWKK